MKEETLYKFFLKKNFFHLSCDYKLYKKAIKVSNALDL